MEYILIKPKSILFPAKFSFESMDRTTVQIQVPRSCFCSSMSWEKTFSIRVYESLSTVRSLEDLIIEELDCDKFTGSKIL